MAAEDLMLVGARGEEIEPDDWLWPDPAPKVWQHLSLVYASQSDFVIKIV